MPSRSSSPINTQAPSHPVHAATTPQPPAPATTGSSPTPPKTISATSTHPHLKTQTSLQAPSERNNPPTPIHCHRFSRYCFAVAVAFVFACSFVCHPVAKRRDLLSFLPLRLFLPLPMPFLS